MNPFHTLTFYFFKARFNITLPSTSYFPKCLFPSHFPTKILYVFLCVSSLSSTCFHFANFVQKRKKKQYWVERNVFAFSKRWRKHKLYCHLFKPFWCLSCHYINYASNGNYIID
jgi:hypothetical protein